MTWSPSDSIVAAALAHAEACAPLESCGLVIGDAFFPVANLRTDRDAFVMDMRAALALQKERGPAQAIVHSHVYLAPVASDADRTMCETTGLPWLILNWPTGKWAVVEPTGYRAPLVGRQWAWGVHDCYSIVRDGLQDYAGITMPEFFREWDFWRKGGDTIVENLEAAGLVRVDDEWRHCDIIGMKIRSPVVNHLGLFLAPDVILHQMTARLSVREVYGGVYALATELHLRHRALLDRGPS